MRHVGNRVARPEGPAKVEGRAVYVDDIPRAKDEWVGGTLRSPVAHGKLRCIERGDFDFSRVVVVTAEDIPGDNVQALIVDDQPILCADTVRHVEEPIALVAAPDQGTLCAALDALEPRIDPLEPVFDAERSQDVQSEISIDKGDVDATFEGATRIVEGEYHTDSQEQLYIETQGMIADPPTADGTITVRGSLQCPHYVQKALRRAFAVPPEKARVVQCETGGGFGGKEDYPSVVACHAALLAHASGHRVRMVYDRNEDLLATPKRHPSRVRHRTVVADDGTLLAMDIDVLLDGGAYTTLSPVVLSRGVIHAAGAYRCDNIRIRGRVVGTNHVPYGAFRGFGAPQVCFAIERQMDRIAASLGIHPVVIRQRNMLRLGDRTATSQLLKESVGSEEVLRRILAHTGFDRHEWRKERSGNKRRGVGLSFFYHGAGFTGSGEEMLKGKVTVELDDDGCALVRAGSTEIGQGKNAMFTAIAADALGAEPDAITIVDPDTAAVPDSGPTVASRTCMIVGGCLDKACRTLADRVGGDPNTPFRERASAFVRGGGDAVATETYGSPPGLQWDQNAYRGDAYPVFGWAADVAEVEVDLTTFDVEIVRFVTCVDVGHAIQPQIVEGQIEGGTLQSIGWSHIEVMTAENGRFRQDRLATCIIPTSLDTPPIDVLLVEEPFSNGPFGAKGVGELPMDGGAPAIASAIEDAIGVHVTHVPATPERLLEAWLEAHPDDAFFEAKR